MDGKIASAQCQSRQWLVEPDRVSFVELLVAEPVCVCMCFGGGMNGRDGMKSATQQQSAGDNCESALGQSSHKNKSCADSLPRSVASKKALV